MIKDKNIEQLTVDLLNAIGEDPNREGLLRTPLRVAKAWDFFSTGYTQSLDEIVNNALFSEDNKDMVVVRDVEFYSL